MASTTSIHTLVTENQTDDDILDFEAEISSDSSEIGSAPEFIEVLPKTMKATEGKPTRYNIQCVSTPQSACDIFSR